MAFDNIKLGFSKTAQETAILAGSSPAAGAQSLTHNAFNRSKTLSSGSTPAVTKIAFFEQALTAGAATIDLTALPHNGGLVDGSGLKVQAWGVIQKAGNAALTITAGASNGYNLLGAADGKLVLSAHASVDSEAMFFAPEGLPDVAGADKTIDLAGTGTESFYFWFALG